MNGGKINPEIFRAYDIRGVYGEDYDDAFAQRLGARVVGYLDAKVLVVGRDLRASSDELAYGAIEGALSAGAKVIDVGELSSPQFYWAIRSLGAAGGIMVTASHNPPEYNGFKVIGHDGEIIGGNHLRQIYDWHGRGHRIAGTIEYRDVVPDYADAVAYASGWQGGTELKISVDGPPSVARVLGRLGPIAPDDGLAAKLDADGDRIQFYSDGVAIPADFIFLLLAEKFHLSPLVFDLRFSRIVREALDKKGVQYRVSKVGRLYLSDAMRTLGAVLGGEMSGHFYWKEFGGMECPELTLVKFLQAIGQDSANLKKILEPYQQYAKSDEINIPVRDQKDAARVLERAAAAYPKCVADRTDGVTVDCWEHEGFWFNIRPSNTEPLMRVVVETKEKDLLATRVKEVRELIG